LNQTDDSKTHYAQLPQRYHRLSGFTLILIKDISLGKPSLTQKISIAVSQSVTLTDHLLKCTSENFSGLGASTKLAIGTEKTYIKVFGLLKYQAISRLKPEYKS
jgi:succinyl-CoA synthetase alpha subunit